MAALPRYLLPQVRSDLARKMVFVAGPRQVGKTTLARRVARGAAGYLNWDVAADRERILSGELPVARLWIFDEIHKYRRWRDYLKGIYDGRPPGQRILVISGMQVVGCGCGSRDSLPASEIPGGRCVADFGDGSQGFPDPGRHSRVPGHELPVDVDLIGTIM